MNINYYMSLYVYSPSIHLKPTSTIITAVQYLVSCHFTSSATVTYSYLLQYLTLLKEYVQIKTCSFFELPNNTFIKEP